MNGTALVLVYMALGLVNFGFWNCNDDDPPTTMEFAVVMLFWPAICMLALGSWLRDKVDPT